MASPVATIRPHKKWMKLAYKVLKTPKELRQDNQRHASTKMRKAWYRDSQLSQ